MKLWSLLASDISIVGKELTSDVTLLDYIRNYAELRGTKYMCREGGCGACVVSAVRVPGEPVTAVNSCLVAVTSCHDWDITTIEKVGNRLDGYHPVQKSLADHHGTQCGYCSPGFVMSMYSLLKQKGDLKMLDVEKSLASNVCRCTGYRPILDAFKKFAKDSPDAIEMPDIEDLMICTKTGKACGRKEGSCDDDWCVVNSEGDDAPPVLKIDLKDDRKWYRVHNIPDIFAVLKNEGTESYRLINGNTGKGAYPIKTLPRVLIDISGVEALRGVIHDQNLIVGAGLTLTEFMDLCKITMKEDGFGYLEKFVSHIDLVAHIPVRNLGTIGGNLMVKNQHNDFPSDIFLLLETVGAQVTILNEAGDKKTMTLLEFIVTDMTGKLLLNILLPPLEDDYKMVTFKIMPRAQNAHAVVNAGFLYKLHDSKVLEATIVYGGLSPKFTRAFSTENLLVGKDLFSNSTLKKAVKSLDDELVVEEKPPEPKARFRKQLAINLFYKGLLSLCPENRMDSRYVSGRNRIKEERPVSQGKQKFDTDKALWPLTEPVPKIEAMIQCAGEARYTEDMPSLPNEVFASFVLSEIAVGEIESMDASRALAKPGVIAFYKADDIPGVNAFTAPGNILFIASEEVLSSGEVKYFNQPIGIIVAESRALADEAAKMVDVKYKNVKKPIIDIKEAKKIITRNTPFFAKVATHAGVEGLLPKVIKGSNTIYAQYHFTMETLVCVTKPTEEGLEVHPASQWFDEVQIVIGRALKMPQNKIDVNIRRLGGAYGIKISRASQTAVACALVTKLLNRPCRLIQSLTTNMRAVGKRLPCAFDFVATVSSSGTILVLSYDMYIDNGYMLNELFPLFIIDAYYNCYDMTRWTYKGFNTITDTAKNTFCRSPGTLESVSNSEHIMEQISYELDLDPFEVRLNNVDILKFKEMKEMTDTLKETSNYEKRKKAVEKFNKENRWKKRGIRCSFLKWSPVGCQYLDVNVSVFHEDGTVSIVHGGVEIGQGLNTKAAQVAAYILKIPLEKIQIKGADSNIAPNSFVTGGSTATQCVCLGVRRACEELNNRLNPLRLKLIDPLWEVLIKAAHLANIDLQAHGFTSILDTKLYHIGGAAVAEVEVDVLTGEHEILRVDLIQDAGRAVSPNVDIGQVEGAFIMGLGYWTCEHLVYDHDTGEMLTDRTWDYHVPQARDIPQDFRVSFREKSFSDEVIFGAKGTGEPSTCMAIVVPFAIRKAISAAREEVDIPSTKWFKIVGCEVSSDLTLVEYIRNYAELRGTKYMCREAGCGACIVSVVKEKGGSPIAVNSCMVSITSCENWDITTVEKVGNRLDGYHPIQKTLAKYNGTQCGYCTPGWIMAMYSLKQSKKDLTMLEIEKSFGSNVCRCTGYRPILDGFKCFAKDAPKSIEDIEDLKLCEKGRECKKECGEDDWCVISKSDVERGILELTLHDGKKWFRINDLRDAFLIFSKEGDDSYMLVSGNTAKGAYPILEYPRILIDITQIPELKGHYFDQNLVVGAGTTLTEFLEICLNLSVVEYFKYLKKFYDHINLVAHNAVRNIGSIAGNLMIKHEHNDFPSDIFLLLETVGAALVIYTTITNTHVIVNMQDFLKLNMRGKIIVKVLLPPLTYQYRLVTFKIMPKSQNAHAIVNAGFLYSLSENNTVLEARIVYGGLSPYFTRSFGTEEYLIGKKLYTDATLRGAIDVLAKDLVVVENPPEPSAAFRKKLAINLFYKGLITLVPHNQLNQRYSTGSIKLHEVRPVSDARQIFDTDPKLWPLNEPVQKLEALIQCSGEAEYTEDIPSLPHEVFASFALSTVAMGTIVHIDPTEALKKPGVIAFYTANDIPGVNSFTPAGTTPFYVTNEEIICSGEIKYFNQPIGIVVAETRAIADRAAKLVKATYKNVKKPIIDVKEAKNDPKRNTLVATTPAREKGADVVKTIIGSQTIYTQYHFSMETLVCVSRPIEDDSLEVFAATQYMDGIQVTTARMLKIDQNSVDVYVRRLGGAYGIKISREAQVALACNLVAHKLNRPCRFIQSLTTNMRAVGKRFPCTNDFKVEVDRRGKIQSVDFAIYEDNGFLVNEPLATFGTDAYYNCYDNSRWNYRCFNTLTDTAKNTFCRSPGTLESIAMAEYLMERISYEINADPLEVRLANLDEAKYSELKPMIEDVKEKSDYTNRREFVDVFNRNNKWKKRGLRFALLRWSPVGSQYFDITLSVFHEDGSVAITHGGIEMGQGLNTKAAQICAYYLKIPLHKIKVKANNTNIAPNGFVSGGSLTSQNVGIGVERACKDLLKRLEPTRIAMGNPTWEDLIKRAFQEEIDLQAHGFINSKDVQNYDIFGVTLAEVEVDVLTGEFEIIRVDLLHDVGRSISPEIDVGQVEGAFIMGLGYWTCEDVVYDHRTGEVLSDRTWNYYVPQARDIPQDFRVYFRKKSYSNDIILGAKVTGEPPICMSIVIPFAIRAAIVSAREESGIPSTEWFQIDGPYTTEKILMALSTKKEDLKFS